MANMPIYRVPIHPAAQRIKSSQILGGLEAAEPPAPTGRIMSSLAAAGGLAGHGGIAGKGGGLAA